MKTNLSGKTALITGASSGLGAEFARQFAGLGCSLILVARRQERLHELKEEIFERTGVSVECLAMDLTEAEASQQLYTHVKENNQTVDILINNAGIGLYGEFLETSWEHLQPMLELDILVLTQLTHLFASDMVRRNSGYILLIGSTGSFQPTPSYAAYSAAKSYVLSLGEALHYELRRTKVKCTVLCPGMTRTEFLEVAGQRPTDYQRVMMMEGAAVVRIGIEALLKGRASVASGRTNAFLAWGTRLLPRQVLAAASARLMR
jgi:uncharacterized protein